MRETMLAAQKEAPGAREDFIRKKIKDWQGYEEQTDDLLICGLFA